jgi:hypothetical protein
MLNNARLVQDYVTDRGEDPDGGSQALLADSRSALPFSAPSRPRLAPIRSPSSRRRGKADDSARGWSRFEVCMGRFEVCMGRFAVCMGRFAVCMGRFAVCMGRFAVCMGRFAVCMGRFAVNIFKVTTELWEAQIDQSGEPGTWQRKARGCQNASAGTQAKRGRSFDCLVVRVKSPSRTVRAIKSASSARPRKAGR